MTDVGPTVRPARSANIKILVPVIGSLLKGESDRLYRRRTRDSPDPRSQAEIREQLHNSSGRSLPM